MNPEFKSKTQAKRAIEAVNGTIDTAQHRRIKAAAASYLAMQKIPASVTESLMTSPAEQPTRRPDGIRSDVAAAQFHAGRLATKHRLDQTADKLVAAHKIRDRMQQQWDAMGKLTDSERGQLQAANDFIEAWGEDGLFK